MNTIAQPTTSKARRLPTPTPSSPPQDSLPETVEKDSAEPPFRDWNASEEDLSSSALAHTWQSNRRRRRYRGRRDRALRPSWDDLVIDALPGFPFQSQLEVVQNAPTSLMVIDPPRKRSFSSGLILVLVLTAVGLSYICFVPSDSRRPAEPVLIASAPSTNPTTRVDIPDADSSRKSELERRLTTARADADTAQVLLSQSRREMQEAIAAFEAARQNEGEIAAALSATQEKLRQLVYFTIPSSEQQRTEAYTLHTKYREQLDSAGSRSEIATRVRNSVNASAMQTISAATERRRRAREGRDIKRQQLGAKLDGYSEAMAEASARVREKRWLEVTVREIESSRVSIALEKYDQIVASHNAVVARIAELDGDLQESFRSREYLESHSQMLADQAVQLARKKTELQRISTERQLKASQLQQKADALTSARSQLEHQLSSL